MNNVQILTDDLMRIVWKHYCTVHAQKNYPFINRSHFTADVS